MNVGGKLISINKPMIMGIINVTPDSFYEDSRYETQDLILKKAAQMLEEGADFIDIGGQSTRPGARLLSAKEERERIIPAIKTLLKKYPKALLSIDTYHSEVAKAAIEHGAVIINDISAGEMDKKMIPLAAKLKTPYIAMHMKGTPANMQKNPTYNNVVQEVFDYFIQKSFECREAGIKDLIIDPGFGFGKTLAHNYQLLNHLQIFHQLSCPLLIGMSRKSMIYKLLKNDSKEALNGSSIVNLLAIQQGAQILRVHDVKPAKELLEIWQFTMKNA